MTRSDPASLGPQTKGARTGGAHAAPRRRFWRFAWRACKTAVSDDFLCPLAGYEGKRMRLEWVQVQRNGDPRSMPVDYEIPRPCVEALGVNCSPLDQRDKRGQQGAVWFTREQANAMRSHRHAYDREVQRV